MYSASNIDILKYATSLDFSGANVDALMTPYYNCGHILYTDHYYTRPALSNYLFEKKTGSCRTVRINRKSMPQFQKQK